MYKRSAGRYPVKWNPNDLDLAAETLRDLGFEPPGEGERIEVSNDEAAEIRYLYEKKRLDREIRTVIENGEDDRAVELKDEYEQHTGEKWEGQ